jgi:hypothetical protein
MTSKLLLISLLALTALAAVHTQRTLKASARKMSEQEDVHMVPRILHPKEDRPPRLLSETNGGCVLTDVVYWKNEQGYCWQYDTQIHQCCYWGNSMCNITQLGKDVVHHWVYYGDDGSSYYVS